MKYLYRFFGGRKVCLFFIILIINSYALFKGVWIAEFSYFCIGLYSVIVGGIEGNKYIKGKVPIDKKE
jgi:hypothetical protein